MPVRLVVLVLIVLLTADVLVVSGLLFKLLLFCMTAYFVEFDISGMKDLLVNSAAFVLCFYGIHLVELAALVKLIEDVDVEKW